MYRPDDIYITPYVPPRIENRLSQILKMHGKFVTLQKKQFLVNKDIIKSFVYVKSGVIGRIRETPILTKQSFLEITPPGCMANFINFFSPGKVKIRILALRHSEVYITPFEKIYALMEKDEEIRHLIYQMYGGNAESSLRSCHCNFIFPCKYRLILLFKALARHSGSLPDANGWIRLPYKLTREEYCEIVFCSLLTLDNTLLEWKKEHLYKKTIEGSFVHVDLLDKDIADSLYKHDVVIHEPTPGYHFSDHSSRLKETVCDPV
ncbi:Crp/Fnr family transcriptional regulator [Edaphovirga cremea]|uniref:Crp/Fnr family transcriptional regulator n=1 Tax=Edaphovirga cremea TaxID=2267246 RepID=UPI00398A321A